MGRKTTIVESEFNKSIGRKLFEARELKGLTRSDLGKMVDLAESTIKRYEDGDIKTLSTGILKTFSDALGVSVITLMGLSDKGTAEPTCSLSCTAIEKELIKKYRTLDERGKSAVCDTLDREYSFVSNEDAAEKLG